MSVSRFTNNMRYLYRESECKTWKEFAAKYHITYNVLSRWLNRTYEPPMRSLLLMAEKLGVEVEYLQQERPQLSLYDLDYWHHAQHHAATNVEEETEKRYTLDEVLDAVMVAEDIVIDRESVERVLFGD